MKSIRIGDVLADYKVIDIAGSGGEGAVYKVEHVITRRIEALKLLPPASSGDPEQVRRFEREIQVQARLHHPHIVALYTAVRDGDSVALVMEFVEGESLQRMLEAGPLPVETAVDFASQVLRALAYAHAAGVIHRDVAPANIIVTPGGVAKLTDFGLARGAADLRLSASGVPLGSPWYMSPEQVRGSGALDARTDIYAMGAVLHSMLTGGKLFEAEGAFGVMRAHVEAEPALPSSRNPKVPPALDDIVRKAVAKDPAMRFQSADEFRLALENAAAGARPVALPPGPSKAPQFKLPRLRLRLRGVSPMHAAVLMALVPAGLVAAFYSIRLLPATARAQATANKPRGAPVSSRDAAPPSAAVAAQVDPASPAIVPSTPPDVPAPTGEPAPSPLPRTQSTAHALRTAAKPTRSYPIQVTGGELQPIAAPPAPSPAPPQPMEAVGPCVPKTNSVTPEASASAPEPAPPEAAPAKPQNAGSRLARALGKVNPFHKKARHDSGETAKTPPDQD